MAKLLKSTVVAASAAVALSVYGEPYLYTVSGACDAQGFINGYSFLRMGATATGAPWFKAVDRETYIYHDMDCMGSGDGTPRWVIDSDKPDVTKRADLDSDHFCDYIARIDSDDISRPPAQGLWTMNCGGSWGQQYLIFLEGTTTPRYPVPNYPPTTTIKPEVYLPPGQSLKLSGLCPMKSYLNDLVYVQEGNTLDKRLFFKAIGREEYIYFDKNCDGNTTGVGRWILDNSRPRTDVLTDLDQDGKCDYHARFDSDSLRPPAAGMWRVYCGETGWVSLYLTMAEMRQQQQQMLNSAPGAAGLLATALAVVCAWVIGM